MFEQTFKNIDDVLWKEAGCTTELDYTEQTSWILFLKYLDDLEQGRAMEAELVGKPYGFIIDPAHTWSKWAAPKKPDGSFDHDNALTGPDLIDYVNQQLFPYLKGFKQRATSPDTIEYKIGEIFSEITNKFQSGYSLRDALELVDELRFQSQKEKHELSHLYEAKIRNMGNAGRNGGEYYTPRPLIRAMIQVIKPKLGERIYDGALGSAGFLCEAYEYLRQGELTTSQTQDPANPHLLRQGEEKPRLCHRHDEHDPARHRRAEHRPHQHARRKLERHPGKGPLRRGPCQSAVRRERTAGGAAEFPDQDRRDGVPVPAAFHQAPEGGRPRRHRHQEHLPVELRRRGAGAAAGTAGELQSAYFAGLPGGTFQGAGVKTVVLFFEKGAPTRKVWYYQLDPGRNMGKTNALNDNDLKEFRRKRGKTVGAPVFFSCCGSTRYDS